MWLKTFVLNLLFLLSFDLVASIGDDLPPGIPSLDNMIKEFRASFETKIKQLHDNYIYRETENSFIFTSHEKIECAWNLIPQNNPLSKIIFSQVNSTDRLFESVKYIDCWETENIIETLITTGSNLKARDKSEIKNANYSFQLKDNESSKRFQIKNFEREEIFSLMLKRTKSGQLATFYIRQQKFLTINRIDINDLSKIIYNFEPYKFEYKRKHKSWSEELKITPWTASIYSYSGNGENKKNVIFRIDSFGRVSQKYFINKINESLFAATLNSLKSIIKYHVYGFPSTDFVSAGAQNNRFLDELRLNYIRLENGNPAELELVKDLIRGYIEAIESRKIIIDDRRSL